MTTVLHRSLDHHYPSAVSAAGMYFEDSSGKRYLDMSGGAAVSSLGHGHPDVLNAVRAQLEQMAYAHTSFFTNEPQERLAKRLVSRFGDDGARVYFTSGGSEANETALKIAWQYWQSRGQGQKKIVISREHSYHGNTLGGLSVSGNADRRAASAAPLHDWPRITPCYAYRCRNDGESLEQFALRVADELDAAIRAAGPERVAAFIFETVVGASLGAVAAEPGYLRRIREICDRHDVLMIADEVMCGSGRTGNYFAFERHGVTPDIVTLAKSIAGGYQPLAATIVSARVMEGPAASGFAHGHTYIGHAAACAAGLAVQDVLDRDELLKRTQRQGRVFREMLHEAFGAHPHVGEIRGDGLFLGIELVRDRQTKQGFPDGAGMADRLRAASMEAGLVCYPGSILVEGATVPHILLAPPMILRRRHMKECIQKLRTIFDGVLQA